MGRYLLVAIGICQINFIEAQTYFSKQEILQDMQYLRTSLEEVHYDLYAYTPKCEFDLNYDKVIQSIQDDSLSALEATSHMQRIISKANNGHTEIPFPGGLYSEYAYAGGTLFPLEVIFESGKAIVRKNWSSESSIPIGSELLTINGMSLNEVSRRFSPHVSAERPYFKNAKLTLYSLPRLYWQLFGEVKTFEIEVLIAGHKKEFQLNSVPVLDGFEFIREPMLNARMMLTFYEESAYLNPGHFGGNENEYRTFIDSAFIEIQKVGSKNLIIDLRNNSGGNDSFSDYLVSYIADKPFKWCSSFFLKTSDLLKEHTRANRDTTINFWRSVVINESGKVYPYSFEEYLPQPIEKRYIGNVYVLINRQSHSQSAVTAAQIQDYGFATIVGEETGDYPSLYASQFTYSLPLTGIEVKVSKGYMIRPNGSEKQDGVIPDVFIKDHFLDEEDEIFEGLLKRLKPN